MSRSREFDFPYAGSYAPGADDAGYRSFTAKNTRYDVSEAKRRGRAFDTLQRLRTFDWAFVQSGALVTADRNLGFASSARGLEA